MSITTQTPVGSVDHDREYAEKRRDFRIHAMVATASTVLIVIVNLFINAMAGITGNIWAWWSIWMLVGWGFALMIHGILVMAARPLSPPSP